MHRLQLPAEVMEGLDKMEGENGAMRILLWQVLDERECPGEKYCGGGRVGFYPRWCVVCRIRSFLGLPREVRR